MAPADRGLALDLEELPDGRLNPILDSHGRTYLYASNVAINQGQAQPVRFAFGERLRLTDADANELDARIIHIEGRSALVEYRRIGP
jgi:hypothetical protein